MTPCPQHSPSLLKYPEAMERDDNSLKWTRLALRFTSAWVRESLLLVVRPLELAGEQSPDLLQPRAAGAVIPLGRWGHNAGVLIWSQSWPPDVSLFHPLSYPTQWLLCPISTSLRFLTQSPLHSLSLPTVQLPLTLTASMNSLPVSWKGVTRWQIPQHHIPNPPATCLLFLLLCLSQKLLM